MRAIVGPFFKKQPLHNCFKNQQIPLSHSFNKTQPANNFRRIVPHNPLLNGALPKPNHSEPNPLKQNFSAFPNRPLTTVNELFNHFNEPPTRLFLLW